MCTLTSKCQGLSPRQSQLSRIYIPDAEAKAYADGLLGTGTNNIFCTCVDIPPTRVHGKHTTPLDFVHFMECRPSAAAACAFSLLEYLLKCRQDKCHCGVDYSLWNTRYVFITKEHEYNLSCDATRICGKTVVWRALNESVFDSSTYCCPAQQYYLFPGVSRLADKLKDQKRMVLVTMDFIFQTLSVWENMKIYSPRRLIGGHAANSVMRYSGQWNC